MQLVFIPVSHKGKDDDNQDGNKHGKLSEAAVSLLKIRAVFPIIHSHIRHRNTQKATADNMNSCTQGSVLQAQLIRSCCIAQAFILSPLITQRIIDLDPQEIPPLSSNIQTISSLS